MKRIIAIFVVSVFLFTSMVYFAGASEELQTTSTTVEYFEDGSYVVVTVKESLTPRASELTKTGSKTYSFYNSDNELLWEYVLTGKFYVVMNVSAECIESTYSYTIYDDSWSLTAHNNYCSANVAHGTATFKKKVLFITTNTQNIEVTLTCDLRANLT